MLELEEEILELMITNEGSNVFEISKNKNVMLVFLRHFGCQFCRETIHEISRLRPEIEIKKTESDSILKANILRTCIEDLLSYHMA